MTRSNKHSPAGLMDEAPNRRIRDARSGEFVQKSGKRVSASFVTNLDLGLLKFKNYGHEKRRNVDKNVVFQSVTETAIASISQAFTAADEAVNHIVPENELYPGLTALESDDMWFGDPKDMPEEDLAFFGLEK